MTDLYNRQMAVAVRNVVTLTRTRYTDDEKGAVPIQEYLELQMPPAKAALILRAFYGWYRSTYAPQDAGSDLNLKILLNDKTPLYICGLLSEFADYIDEVTQTASTFESAVALIREHGWIQRDSGGPGQGYCILGALDTAARRQDKGTRSDLLWRNALRSVREALGTTFVAAWNDAPGRTVEEVIHLLREVGIGLRVIR